MPENLPNPALLNYTVTIKTEQLTVPSTFVQNHPSHTLWRLGGISRDSLQYLSFPSQKNIANVPKFSSLLSDFFKEPFVVAHRSDGVAGQLEKAIYDLT